MAEKLENIDRLILKGVSLGYKTPRRISEKVNVDVETLRGRIIDLGIQGYLSDTQPGKAPIIDRIIALLSLENYVACGKLTGKGCDALDDDLCTDVISGFKSDKGVFKRVQNRPRSFMAKLVDGALHLVGIIAFIVIILVVLVVIAGIAIFVLWRNPVILSYILDGLFSLLPL